MTKIHFPQFSRDEFSSSEMRQLIQALELRFQSIESSIDESSSVTGSISNGEFAPLVHTHVESEITDLDHTSSIFELADVTGTPDIADTLVWNGSAFETAPAGSISLALNDLSNVSVPAPSDQQVLTWVASRGVWEAQDVSSVGSGKDRLFDLLDTNISNQVSGDLLFTEDGEEWIPTGFGFQWFPSQYIQLSNDITINWYDSTAAVSVENLAFTEITIGEKGFIIGDPLYQTVIDGSLSTVTGDLFVDGGSAIVGTFGGANEGEVLIANDLLAPALTYPANDPLLIGEFSGTSNTDHLTFTRNSINFFGADGAGNRTAQWGSINGYTPDGWNLVFGATTRGGTIYFAGGGEVGIRDDGVFRVYGGGTGDTDWAEFKHDGTDFITDFTNTLDWNIVGANLSSDSAIITQTYLQSGVYTSATKPAPGTAGRTVFNSDYQRPIFDDGTFWRFADGTYVDPVAEGAVSLDELTASGIAAAGRLANGAISLEALTASGVAEIISGSTGAVTLEEITASGTATKI